jgi:hypothetical protein
MGAPSCIELAPGTELATRSVHWLPATIEHSGAARVATFFEPLVEGKTPVATLSQVNSRPLPVIATKPRVFGRNISFCRK